MKEVSLKLKLKTSKASPNAISSQESLAGLSHCNLLESATKPDYGPEARRASRSALPENSLDNSTLGISRQSSSASLASAALQSCLGNRLHQQLQNRGCAIYKLTWKEKTTPSGLPYSQLVASAHRTNATDFSSARTDWPTPAVSLITNDVNMRSTDGRTKPNKLGWASAMAAWPTPTCQSPNSLRGKGQDPIKRKEQGHTVNLTDAVNFVELNQPIRITASGQMLTGSDAGIESSGQLNPTHSRWLMGFPPEWDDCAVTAMQSFRKSLPNSSQLSWVPLTKRLRTKK